MNTKPVLSIIIAVFNMEYSIERCLRSVAEQDIASENFEVIVIDDGSQDRTKEIVLRIQQEFRNIILISQENQGVSAARNLGISSARGKYVLFIDADDYIITNSLGKLIEKANRENLDVLYLNLAVLSNEGLFIGQTDYKHLEGKIFDGIETYPFTRRKKEKDPDRSVGVIFRKAVLENYNLSYLKDVPYLEDGLFGGKVLCLAGYCAFDTRPFYIRITNPDSASNSNLYYTEKARQGFVKAVFDIKDFEKKFDLTTAQKGLTNHLIAKYVLLSVISSIGSKEIKTLMKLKSELQQHGFLNLELNGLISNKGYVRLFNFSFWFFVTYYILETRIKKLLNIIYKH